MFRRFALAVLVVIAAIAVYASMPIREDTRAWNCHVHGNRVCGPSAPWHGFPSS